MQNAECSLCQSKAPVSIFVALSDIAMCGKHMFVFMRFLFHSKCIDSVFKPIQLLTSNRRVYENSRTTAKKTSLEPLPT